MALKPSQLWLDDLLDVLVEEFLRRCEAGETAPQTPVAVPDQALTAARTPSFCVGTGG